MSSDFVESRVREIVAEQLGLGIDDVTPDASLSSDLGADTLDFIELVMALEEEFEQDIDEGDAGAFKTVKDVVEYLSRKA